LPLFENFTRLAVCGLKILVHVLSIALACDMVTTNCTRERKRGSSRKNSKCSNVCFSKFYGHGECY